jgi:hypothetical protein
MKALLFLISAPLIGWFTPLTAQSLQIDFSDADLSAWLGDTDKFSIANEQLQLNDASAGSSNIAYISIPAPTSIGESTTWESWVQLDFSPSAGNFARIYLAASQPDLSGTLNGYYLQIGGITGDQDAIELYRQDGDTHTSLLSATAGAVGGAAVLANIQLNRTEEGLWTLRVDYSGGTDYTDEGSVQDDTYFMGNYFGYYCRYSSTRSDAFYFDELLVDPIFQDQSPPELIAATTLDAQTLAVTFNEALDPSNAAQTALYSLSNGLGEPQSAAISNENPAVVLLNWAGTFGNLQTYTLTIDGIRDLAGNQATTKSIDFTYLEVAFPQAGDLLITEFFPDPSPQLGLPNAEFVELYNSSEKVLELEGVGLSTGSSPKILPAYQLRPGAYLILCDEADVADFSAFGAALGLEGFPALTNGGDELTLTNEDGAVLVALNYDLSWYGDPEKSDGGWTLEMIQTGQSANCAGNWSASNDTTGGTPGRENSVNGNALETAGPILLSAYVSSPTQIVLRFDEALDPLTATDPGVYSITLGISIASATVSELPSEILLSLNTALQAGTVYEVQAGSSIADCLGNTATEAVTRQIGLAEAAEAGDLVINELLYLPEVGGDDFVEFYNRSQKIINLNGWQIRNRQEDGSLRQERIETDFLIFPGEYVVLTEDPQDIAARYTVPFPERMLANNLPTLSDAGQLSMISANLLQIDSFAYSSDLHSPLLSDERGVSLERVDPETPTNSPGNWHSAAGTAGFATPTGENSQYAPIRSEASSNVLRLVQKRFSPDGDGFEDLLLLEAATDRPGYLASISIFDANGRIVRRLLRNELLPTEGVYKWDGSRDDGHKARIGIYVIYVELLHPDGTVEQWKESCVLAGQLE